MNIKLQQCVIKESGSINCNQLLRIGLLQVIAAFLAFQVRLRANVLKLFHPHRGDKLTACCFVYLMCKGPPGQMGHPGLDGPRGPKGSAGSVEVIFIVL